MHQAEVLARLAQDNEKLRRHIDDLQRLLAALHNASARQFQVGGGGGAPGVVALRK